MTNTPWTSYMGQSQMFMDTVCLLLVLAVWVIAGFYAYAQWRSWRDEKPPLNPHE